MVFSPTGMAVEGGAGEGLPVPNKSKDAVLHLMLRFGPKRNIKPERIIDLLMKGHTSSEGMSQRFYSPVLQVARKELYWENSSGQLVTP